MQYPAGSYSGWTLPGKAGPDLPGAGCGGAAAPERFRRSPRSLMSSGERSIGEAFGRR